MLKNFRQQVQAAHQAVKQRMSAYLSRRSHRSFKLSRRRDYIRTLELPGYFSFNNEVVRTLKRYKKPFIGLAGIYAILTIILVGFGSQEAYENIAVTLRQTSENVFQGQWGEIGKAGLLFASIATSGLNASVTDVQQVYTALLFLFVWVTTVWLLRQLLAGRSVRLRDALYNAGAPIIPTLLLSSLLLVQAIPLAIATIGYSAATATGLISGGVEAMLFWIVAGLLTVLSIYLLMSTFFAMIIITLPGTYPMQAIRTAGDIVSGRRVKILLRILWLLVSLVLFWALILIPVILLDSALKSWQPGIEAAPIVPIALLLVGIITVIWSATYVYMLYRKVVEYDAEQQ